MVIATFRFAADLAEVADAPSETGARSVSGLVVPFGVPVNRGGFNAQFSKEGTRLPADLSTVKLLTEHNADHPVGYATDAEYTATGLNMTFSIPAEHPRGAGYLADLDANLRDGFSVGVELDESTQLAIAETMFGDNTDPVDMAGIVREVSAVAVPAFNDARAAAAAELVTFSTITERKEPPMTTDLPVLPTTEELAAQVGTFLATQHTAPAHPLSRFARYDDYAAAVWSGEVAKAERFALVNQITTDNPGVIPPGWLTQIVGILDHGRPAVSAFGGPGALPPSGMDISWPVYAGGFTTLVGVQATEKTDITSVKVSITKATTTLKTYAGGSDISYQLIRRSDPAYLAAYQEIMAIGYSATTDAAFCAALVAGGTALPSTGVTDAATLRKWLFQASLAVQTATGMPASSVVVATDVFANWGGAPGLLPPSYGTANISGTADAATLRVNISGLEVTCDPYLAAGKVIVSNELAAKWLEDGPFPISAEDVTKLGQDVAIWGMGVPMLKVPAGIIIGTPPTLPLEDAGEGTGTRKK